MLFKHLSTGIQIVSAVILTVFTVYSFGNNAVGQNIVNITAILALTVQIQNIVAFYRIYLNQPFLQNIASLILFLSVSLGTLLQKYHPTHNQNYQAFNKFCFVFIMAILAANLLYYVLAVLTLYFHGIRQLYKLARGTILSSSTNLLEEELQLLRNSYKPYRQLAQCTICLCAFEDDQVCIVLPGCDHCFHRECIDDWLNNKSNCPNCRNNIRLGLLRNDY